MSEIKAVVAEDYRHVIEIRDGDTREDLHPNYSSHPGYKNSSFRFRKSDLKEMGILEGRSHVIARFTDRYVVDGEEITTSWRETIFRRHGYHWEEAFGDNSRQDITFIQISVCCYLRTLVVIQGERTTSTGMTLMGEAYRLQSISRLFSEKEQSLPTRNPPKIQVGTFIT